MTLDELLEAFAALSPEEQARFREAIADNHKPARGRPPRSFEQHFEKSETLLFGRDKKVRTQEATRKARERAGAIIENGAEYFRTKTEELIARHGGEESLRRVNLDKLIEIFIAASGRLAGQK